MSTWLRTLQKLFFRPDEFFVFQDKALRILNFGCGNRKQPHQIGVDTGINTAADVRIHPSGHLPFFDETFDRAVSRFTLEHVTELFEIIREVARVLKPGGSYRFIVPHAFSQDAYDDPTHVRFFTLRTPKYFIGQADIHYAHQSFQSYQAFIRLQLTYPQFKLVRYPCNFLLVGIGLVAPGLGEQLMKLPFIGGSLIVEMFKKN